MTKSWWVLLLAIGFMLQGCSDQPYSGVTYIAQGQGFAIMLQFETINGYRMEGTASIVELTLDGKISAYRKPIKGTIEGNAVNFSVINPPLNDPPTVPVSGIRTDRSLELTIFSEGKATPVTFTRGTAEEFAVIVKAAQKESVKLSSKQ